MPASQPAVYWRLDDLEGPQAMDAVSGKGLGRFETQIAYYMPGPQPPAFPAWRRTIAPRTSSASGWLAGCRAWAGYTVELWFYNCMPTDAREVTGYLFSRGPAGAPASGDHLAIGGKGRRGQVDLPHRAERRKALAGTTDVPLRNWVPRESWHHVALVRDGRQRDGLPRRPSRSPRSPANRGPPGHRRDFLGGRNDGRFKFEGRIDEVAVFPAVPVEEMQPSLPGGGRKITLVPTLRVGTRSTLDAATRLWSAAIHRRFGFPVGNALRGVPGSGIAASVAIECNATAGVPYRFIRTRYLHPVA